MVRLRKKDVIILICALILIACAMFIRYMGRTSDSVPEQISLIRSAIYIGLISAWGISVRKRIIQLQVRRYLTAISVLMVLWLLFRSVKYSIGSIDAQRYLWYLYYLPMFFIPLLSLFVAISIGKPEDFRLPHKFRLLYIPTALLFLLVMTNDLHRFVFSFPSGVFSDRDYSYSPGYYVIIAWEAICAVSALCIIFSKCRIPYSKKYLFLPILPFGLLVVYLMAYVKDIYWVWLLAGDITVSVCLFITAVYECCIQCGLIQSNIGYNELFEATTIRAQLADGDFNTICRSASASDILKSDMERAVNGTVQLDKNTLLKGFCIGDGFVFWQEDISEITKITEQLVMTRDELKDTGDILKAESEQQSLKFRIEEKNRLYDLIEEKISHQISLLSGLLDRIRHTDDINGARRLFGQVVIIGTYVKRRSNLIFLAGQKRKISVGELCLCLNESASSLQLCGVGCHTEVHIYGAPPSSEKTIMVYDLFEAVVEKSMDSLSSLLFFAEIVDGRLSVNISVVCDSELFSLSADFPLLEVERDEDGIWYLSLSEGGGQK